MEDGGQVLDFRSIHSVDIKQRERNAHGQMPVAICSIESAIAGHG